MYQSLNDVQKRRLFNSVFASFVLLATFLGAQTLNALKENSYIGRGTATNVINVTGTGEILAIPDTGQFSFSVVETGKTVAVAQDLASKKVNSVINAVKALGVNEKDIKTDSYNSYPKYEYSGALCIQTYPNYCPPGKQILTGYEVDQTISIKIRKTADAGAVLTKVGSLGVSNISGLNFVIDDMNAVQSEARDKAVADAKDKANKLAKTLGIKLRKIVNFYESGNQPIYYGMEAKAMGSDVSAPTVPQIPTGENKITSNVTITYEVE